VRITPDYTAPLPAAQTEGEPLLNVTPPPAPAKLLLTVPEAADLLGIGRTLMYELISSGQVVSVLVGRLRRIRPADLETYAAGLVAADAESVQTAA
jgi:excisionase family DNA binding protein